MGDAFLAEIESWRESLTRSLAHEGADVRRAGGAYYTPAGIVDYIVVGVLGRLVGQFPLRVLDPACGAGAFLLGAYQYLLDWYLERYVADGPERWAAGGDPRLARTDSGGDWRLTTAERGRILREHIYGVDLDPQAVEVARLSLLLKSLEGAREPAAHAGTLAELDGNVKWGNALVGPDFYTSRQSRGLDEADRRWVGVFDWATEFPQVSSGFDAVIGNPPYVSFYSRESIKPLPAVEAYLARRFADEVGGRRNTFLFFLAQALRLRSPHGYVGMIVPDTLATNDSYERTRRALVAAGLESVARLEFPAFDGPVLRTVIPIVGPGQGGVTLRTFSSPLSLTAVQPDAEITLPRQALLARSRARWPSGDRAVEEALDRIEAGAAPLDSLAETRDGVNPGPRSFRARILNPPGAPRPTWRPALQGRHVQPFRLLPTADVVDYDPALLTAELKKAGASFRDPQIFTPPKLVSRQTANTLIFALDDVGYCTLNSVHNTRPRDGERCTLLYLLGLLNSSLLRFYYRQRSQETRDVFPQVHISALRQLPIRPFDPASGGGIVALVEQTLALHGQLAAARDEADVRRQIAAVEAQIDGLVCELYDVAGLVWDVMRET
jgi:hypothetical protein